MRVFRIPLLILTTGYIGLKSLTLEHDSRHSFHDEQPVNCHILALTVAPIALISARQPHLLHLQPHSLVVCSGTCVGTCGNASNRSPKRFFHISFYFYRSAFLCNALLQNIQTHQNCEELREALEHRWQSFRFTTCTQETLFHVSFSSTFQRLMIALIYTDSQLTLLTQLLVSSIFSLFHLHLQIDF